jgi:hypothetical protein
MPIIDIRAHGGQFGGGKYRKNSKIPATVLSPPSVPVYAKSDWSLYTYTSSTLSLSYDPFEDVIIGTHFSSSTETRIIRSKPNDLKAISNVGVYSDNSGNNPSTKLSNCQVYVSSLNRYYATYAVYPTGQSEIRVFNANTGSVIKYINNTGIDVILTRTSEYVIYFSSYWKKIFKLTFADDSVIVISDLSSYNMTSCYTVTGWDKVIITDGSNSRLYNLDGTYTGITIPNINVMSPAFYHPPSNSIIRLKYNYGTNGGHFIELYNPTNFSLIASYRLTNRNSVFNSGWRGSNPYYDSKNKILLVAYEDYGEKYVIALPIANNGTIVGWDYGDTSGNQFTKFGRVEGGNMALPVHDGLVCYQKEIADYYYKYLQTVKTYYTLTN